MGFGLVCAPGPCCSIPLRIVHLRTSLLQRLEQLRHKLAHQIETLPLGNEAWIHTERELVAAEQALQSLGAGER